MEQPHHHTSSALCDMYPCAFRPPGMFAGMRAVGPKADLALIAADGDAVAAGVFTTNVMAAAPVTYCREVLSRTDTVRAVRPSPDPEPRRCSLPLP